MSYIIVVVSVFVASIAQMMLKKGATISHSSFLKEYLNVWVLGGYTLMGISMLVNIFAMSRGVRVKEVSIIESLSYLFVPVLSWILFKEGISLRKWLSIVVILIGMFVFFQNN